MLFFAGALLAMQTAAPLPAQLGWRHRSPGPVVRDGHAMAYDLARQRIVLFGGTNTSWGPSLPGTWEWDGATWVLRSPPESPVPVSGHAMAYDVARQRVILFGGRDARGFFNNVTWEWDGNTWTRRASAVSPPARWYHAMVYDLGRRRIVLFGGWHSSPAGLVVFNDTWEWDGTDWARRSATTSPPARGGHAMAYDIARGRVVLFGGSGLPRLYLNDTWEWDGTDWVQRNPRRNPPARWAHAMANDLPRGRVVLFGGASENPQRVFVMFNDTWEWDGTDWVQRNPSRSPLARFDHAMVYDAGRRRVVLFGGGQGLSGQYSDTWEWDGGDWTDRTPAVNPMSRSAHAMAYDIARRGVVLFGGQADAALNDTWIWTGRRWEMPTPSTRPAARSHHAMAYDGANQRVVLFGGGIGGAPSNDTWEWDGAAWARRTPARNPLPRSRHAMAYDAVRRRVVLFGGEGQGGFLGDTWEWDGASWTLRTPAVSPTERGSHAMAYDAARRRTVLFGGEDNSGFFDDTWEWDGSNWMLRAPARRPFERIGHVMAYETMRQRVVMFGGRRANLEWIGVTQEWDGSGWSEPGFSEQPLGRKDHAMAYDEARGRMVLFGGESLFIQLNDTWELTGARPGAYAAFGSGCAGARGLPGLGADWVPEIGQPFRLHLWGLPLNQPGVVLLGTSRTAWAGVPLPLGLAPSGMPGCSLHVSGQVLGAAAASASGVLTWGFPVPNDPALVGGQFFNQAFFLDPPANAAGLIASNAGHGTVGG